MYLKFHNISPKMCLLFQFKRINLLLTLLDSLGTDRMATKLIEHIFLLGLKFIVRQWNLIYLNRYCHFNEKNIKEIFTFYFIIDGLEKGRGLGLIYKDYILIPSWQLPSQNKIL